MKNIGIVLVAAIAVLVLGFGARGGTQTAHAQVDGSVVIGCEFLLSSIDGNVDNTPNFVYASDILAACTGGLTATKIDAIAGNCNGNATAGETGLTATATCGIAESGIGDNDGILEVSDFDDIDLDANQMTNGSATQVTYAIAFVDNDGTVTFDADTGLLVAVNDDGCAAVGPSCLAADVAPATDGNAETCGGAEGADLDCSTAGLSDGDGVVVAALTESTTAGTDVVVDIFQADDVNQISIETISVVGPADTIVMTALKDTVQISGTSALVTTCKDTSDISDGAAQLGDINRTIVKATVTDNDDVELTRVVVAFATDDATVGTFDGLSPSPDSGEPSSEAKSFTGVSVDSGAAGIGSFAVICGGTTTGIAAISGTINAPSTNLNFDDDSVDINVVGEPDNVVLTVTPAAIDCNGTQTASVTATVTDANGDPVADGTSVNFSVVALGTANPINVDTVAGAASSTVTPLSNATAGVTVIVSAGDAQASIRVDCNPALAATATPGGPVATATPRGGVIGGPDTGSGGYLGQDSSAGFPLWTLVALALGSVALVAGGLATRRAGK